MTDIMTQKISKRKLLGIKDIMGVCRLEGERIGKTLSIVVSGVLSVKDFSDTAAVLLIPSGELKIEGKSLSITVFENRSIMIKGKIGGIMFL